MKRGLRGSADRLRIEQTITDNSNKCFAGEGPRKAGQACGEGQVVILDTMAATLTALNERLVEVFDKLPRYFA